MTSYICTNMGVHNYVDQLMHKPHLVAEDIGKNECMMITGYDFNAV